MAYENTDFNWKFTVPQAGEVDSSESMTRMLGEIDAALLTPDERDQLTDQGQGNAEGSTRDDYLSELAGHDVFTTDLHYHSSSIPVQNAQSAQEAGHAALADDAKTAQKLSPGASINGHLFTGASDVTINASDIPGVNKVYWGAVEPSQYTGFGPLTPGDLYIRVV